MTCEEWQADLVERALEGRWPLGVIHRQLLLAGPCEDCGALMRGRGARIASCDCGKQRAAIVGGELAPPCNKCGGLVEHGSIVQAADGKLYSRISCQCGNTFTRL